MTNLPDRYKRTGRPPDQDKRDSFVASYFETGNKETAAKFCGCTIRCADDWVKADWFKKAMRELNREHDKGLDNKITKLLNKTLDQLSQRLETGDEKVLLTRDGEFRTYQQLTAKDLAIVTGVLFDKRNQLRKEPEKDDAAESALDRIADKLRQYSLTEKLQGPAEVVDVEDTSEKPC
jgi:hypothetical protein